MTSTRKIFIGSSSEALQVAKLVEAVIREAGLEPLVWDTGFPVGDMLLNSIERLPDDVDGAVLLWTPDAQCQRKGATEPVPVMNVIFEYGYLSARLTPQRVAICRFGDATIPSDLQGMKIIQAGNYEQGDPLPLPESTIKDLRNWFKQLPFLAEGIPTLHRVHGYSGRWRVENKFSYWRNMPIQGDNRVGFSGTTFLLLALDGKTGCGTQSGTLIVDIDRYHAEYEIANEVTEASVDEEGTLRMHVKVLSRKRIDKKGKLPDTVFGVELVGNQEFDLELACVPNEIKKLQGRHAYAWAGYKQEASEDYTYLGF